MVNPRSLSVCLLRDLAIWRFGFRVIEIYRSVERRLMYEYDLHARCVIEGPAPSHLSSC